MSTRNMLILYSSTNSKGKHDATGAFIPESKKFADWYMPTMSVTRVGIECRGKYKYQRRTQVYRAIKLARKLGPITDVVFFCHGTKKSIQFGFNVNNLDALLNRIAVSKVGLYCCSCGKDNGIARLWSYMSRGKVFSHTTRGHTSNNPKVALWRNGLGHVFNFSDATWRDWLHTPLKYQLYEMLTDMQDSYKQELWREVPKLKN